MDVCVCVLWWHRGTVTKVFQPLDRVQRRVHTEHTGPAGQTQSVFFFVVLLLVICDDVVFIVLRAF